MNWRDPWGLLSGLKQYIAEEKIEDYLEEKYGLSESEADEIADAVTKELTESEAQELMDAYKQGSDALEKTINDVLDREGGVEDRLSDQGSDDVVDKINDIQSKQQEHQS